MPLAVAFALSFGTFFGYVVGDTRQLDKWQAYYAAPVKHHNIPWTFKK